MWDSQSNPDFNTVPPPFAAAGPRLGFLGAFEAAYDDQARNSSLDGLAWYFSKADEDQADRARKAGADYTPLYRRTIKDKTGQEVDMSGGFGDNTYGWRAYRDMAKAVQDGEENWTNPGIAEHNIAIQKLNEANPNLGLKTMTDLFDGVRKSAKEAETRTQLPYTIGGHVGGFIGDIGAGLDPRTNLFNTLTLPVGGIGKSIGGRVLTQGLGQGVIESINQATGVQENRRLLGLDSGLGNALWSVAGAAVGGAVVQGAAEGVVLGARRYATGKWFADAPHDPAPPQPSTVSEVRPIVTPPEPERRVLPQLGPEPYPWERSPMSQVRAGGPRAQADYQHVDNVLKDWGGARPWEIPTPTDTRIPNVEPVSLDYKSKLDRGVESLDSIARRVDPEVFHIYDKLAATKNEARDAIEALRGTRQTEAEQAVGTINDTIDALRAKTEAGTTARLEKKYAARISELTAQRDEAISRATVGDTPEMAAHRQRLIKADEDMRDLAPTVTRAYARAQTKWDVYNADKARIDAMIREGAPGIDGIPRPRDVLPDDPPAALFSPAMPTHVAETAQAKPGEAVAETVTRVTTENKKLHDEALATFQQAATRVSSDEGKAETSIKLQIAGKEIELQLDGAHIVVPNEDGTGTRQISARQLMAEIEKDNQMLQAVTTCSITGISPPA